MLFLLLHLCNIIWDQVLQLVPPALIFLLRITSGNWVFNPSVRTLIVFWHNSWRKCNYISRHMLFTSQRYFLTFCFRVWCVSVCVVECHMFTCRTRRQYQNLRNWSYNQLWIHLLGTKSLCKSSKCSQMTNHCSSPHRYFFFRFSVLFSCWWDRVSLCSPDCPKTNYID